MKQNLQSKWKSDSPVFQDYISVFIIEMFGERKEGTLRT